ncbi:hypothetical protein [Chlorogloeopsis sp. ULAP01]|uniref:hypothetical protein n=1 Tax=Chlorogloeopsis sp. ULAP01 TaxID=3056483 RepID=UPI0025ABC716|nr:hypothetical protein [Chlorogloeopsis sp. ULAP01]
MAGNRLSTTNGYAVPTEAAPHLPRLRVYTSHLRRRTVRCQEKRRAGVPPNPTPWGPQSPPL